MSKFRDDYARLQRMEKRLQRMMIPLLTVPVSAPKQQREIFAGLAQILETILSDAVSDEFLADVPEIEDVF